MPHKWMDGCCVFGEIIRFWLVAKETIEIEIFCVANQNLVI